MKCNRFTGDRLFKHTALMITLIEGFSETVYFKLGSPLQLKSVGPA